MINTEGAGSHESNRPIINNWTSRLECRLLMHSWVGVQILHIAQLENLQNLFLCLYVGFLASACFLYEQMDLKFFTKYFLYLDPKRSLALAAFPVVTKVSKGAKSLTVHKLFLLVCRVQEVWITQCSTVCAHAAGPNTCWYHTLLILWLLLVRTRRYKCRGPIVPRG